MHSLAKIDILRFYNGVFRRGEIEMCVFCAAIPVAAATGVTVHGKQLAAKHEAAAAGVARPTTKPVMQITAGVILLLMIGSATYHTLTYLPY
jgi:hypothetical protein